MGYMSHVMEMGKVESFESLPVGCVFRWPGGYSLFKKTDQYTAVLLVNTARKCYPPAWEETVMVYNPQED